MMRHVEDMGDKEDLPPWFLLLLLTHLHSFRKLRHATGASSVRRSMTRSPRVVSRRTDMCVSFFFFLVSPLLLRSDDGGCGVRAQEEGLPLSLSLTLGAPAA